MLISVLCPSRGRPDKAARMLGSCLDTAVRDVEVLFYLNKDDPRLDEYFALSEDIRNRYSSRPNHAGKITNIKSVQYHRGTDNPTGYSWNRLAVKARGELLMLMGDDVVFQTPGWDEHYREAARKYPDGIYVISCRDGRAVADDGSNTPGNPHPTVHRNWIKALDYFVNPMFLHWYVDTWNVDLAKAVGRFIYLDDVLLEHQKCGVIGEALPADDTFRRIRKGCWMTRDKYCWEALKRYMHVDIAILRRAMG